MDRYQHASCMIYTCMFHLVNDHPSWVSCCRLILCVCPDLYMSLTPISHIWTPSFLTPFSISLFLPLLAIFVTESNTFAYNKTFNFFSDRELSTLYVFLRPDLPYPWIVLMPLFLNIFPLPLCLFFSKLRSLSHISLSLCHFLFSFSVSVLLWRSFSYLSLALS